MQPPGICSEGFHWRGVEMAVQQLIPRVCAAIPYVRLLRIKVLSPWIERLRARTRGDFPFLQRGQPRADPLAVGFRVCAADLRDGMI